MKWIYQFIDDFMDREVDLKLVVLLLLLLAVVAVLLCHSRQ